MLECRNCGASLRYDIKQQDMVCDQCQSRFTLEEAGEEKERIAGEDLQNTEDIAFMVFSCPQCGGEIRSFQNEATEFCSFCGAEVTLSGRLSKEKRPKYIVPFCLEKEECIDKFRSYLRKLPFVPAELKSDEVSSKFCGIYMPFWIYEVQQKGQLSLKGSRTRGDYVEYCNINTEIDTTYEKICYDASSAFDDTLAQEVAPFEFGGVKDFQPGYLCGFYTDIADVSSSVYEDKALEEAADRTIQTIVSCDSTLQGMTFKAEEKKKIPGKVTQVQRALLPVWFMTWRTNDRVSYTVVNGTNGKVVADVPVDRRKYMLASLIAGLLAAAVLYLLFPVILPAQSVRIAWIIAFIGLWIYQDNFRKRVIQETHEEDAGYTGARAYYKSKFGKRTMLQRIGGYAVLAVFIIAAFVLEDGASILGSAAGTLVGNIEIILYLISLAGGIFAFVRVFQNYGKLKDKKALAHTLPLAVAAILSIVVLIVNPAHDLYYYALVVLTGLALLWMLLGLLGQYQELSTRPIPEFHNRKRGDGNA